MLDAHDSPDVHFDLTSFDLSDFKLVSSNLDAKKRVIDFCKFSLDVSVFKPLHLLVKVHLFERLISH